MKTCTNCQETKPLSDYYNKKSGKDGKTSLCKICFKEPSKVPLKKKVKTYKDYLKEAGTQDYYKKSLRYQI